MRVVASVCVIVLALTLLACLGQPPGKTGGVEVKKKTGNALPLKTFLATLPPEPTTFTLECQISDSTAWIRERASRGQYYNVQLVDPDPYDSVQGYVRKDSDLGKRLFAILKDGQKHTLTLTVQTDERLDKGAAMIVSMP